MRFVKRYQRSTFLVVLLLILICPYGSVYAKKNAVETGMKLIRAHRYEEAIKILRSNIESASIKNLSEAHLALGMAYFKNARLHRELYNTSIVVHGEYLEKLANVRRKSKSIYVNLYFGETLLAMKQPKKARIYLNKFIKNKKARAKYKDLARVGIGYSYFLQGNKKKALSVWNSIRTKDEEVLTRLALFYITAGLKDKKPVNECNKVLAKMRSSRKVISAQTAINVIGVYARAGLIAEGIRLRDGIDLKTFSYEESLGKNKTIRFYDIALLDSLAELYGKAGLGHLEKAQNDKKTRDGALYYSAELYELLGYHDRAVTMTSSLLSSKKFPKSLRGQLKVKEIFLRNRGSNKNNVDPFRGLLRNRTPGPEMVAEILIACGKMNIECTDALLQATSMVEKNGGKAVSRVNYALGLYYLNKKHFDRSVQFMEAGRDKSNKNSIGHNEPLMLKHIADANFKAKKYSEALEILFALSEQFPSVRQIQVAMQGIYMREQKSAGDVKIF